MDRHGACQGTPEARTLLRRFRQPALTQETVTLAVTIVFFVFSIYDGHPGRCTRKLTELMIAANGPHSG